MQLLSKIKKQKIAKALAGGFLNSGSEKQADKGFPLSRARGYSSRQTEPKRPLKTLPFFYLNKKGQSLIEYLILVALMGVATIGIVRTLNQTVKSRFANAIYALQGKNQKAKTHTLKKEEYQRSDLSNFMSGAASTDKKQKSKK